MSSSLEATQLLQESGVLFAPGKAANAGGVAVSALEMAQNSSRISWSFEEVDCKLRNISNHSSSDSICKRMHDSRNHCR